MKTKNFIIISILAGFLISSTLFAGNNLSSSVLNFRLQLTESLHDHLIMTKDMNDSKADLLLQIKNDGKVKAINVNYPNQDVAKDIKAIVEKENFDNTHLQPGFYSLTVKFYTE
jgi:hypothetical protein